MPPIRVFTVTMTSSTTLTSAIDLGDTGFEKVSVVLPTHTSAFTTYFQVAQSATDTFYRLAAPEPGTGTAQQNDVSIASGSSARIIEMNQLGNFRHLKFEISTAHSSALNFGLICQGKY